MAVITFAQLKGGSGKTTLALVVTAELAARGVRVACIDLDVTMNLTEILSRSPILGNLPTQALTPNGPKLGDILRSMQKEHEVIIIDVMGAPTKEMLFAVAMADLVVVPSQASASDLNRANETWDIILDAETMQKRVINKVVVLNQTLHQTTTRATRHTRNEFANRGIETLDVELFTRTAFKDATYTGVPPNIADPESGAGINATVLAKALIARIPHGNEYLARPRAELRTPA